jgi:hypothetical protein
LEGRVLVAGRGAQENTPLGMRCDSKEIPSPLSGEPATWWIAARCIFAAVPTPSEELPDEAGGALLVEAPAAFCVSEGRLLGIVSPNDPASEALWWAWSLASTRVETSGTRGLFKKRPAAVVVHRGGGYEQDGGESAIFRQVMHLTPGTGGRHGTFQPRRESELLEALRG